jgi:hypothetical protein
MSRLIDNEGVIYDRGFDGEYRPRTGLFGSQTDRDLFGNARIQRSWLGNLVVKRNWLGDPIRSANGNILYINADRDDFSDFWGLVLSQLLFLALVAVLVFGLLLVTAAISPIVLGIYFYFNEKRRFSGLLWWLWIGSCFVGGISTTALLTNYFPSSELGAFPLIFYLPLGLFALLITLDHKNQTT